MKSKLNQLDILSGVINSPRYSDWAIFFEAAQKLNLPDGFLSASERLQAASANVSDDLFAGWQE